MASRMAEREALAERCRKVGWRVERFTDGYRVFDNSNGIHTIHLTPSDRNANTALRRDLRNAGLDAEEKRITMARITESRTRAQIAQEAAEKKGKELAAKAALIKAAGPYMVAAEDVDLDWLVTPHAAPMVKCVNITPGLARAILDDYNADNRPRDKNVVGYYRDIILAGMWHLTHQGLAFDVRGMCQDGQHRLAAVALAGLADEEFDGVPFYVFVGMPEENFKAIDEGKLRTAAQLFGRTGEKNNSTMQTTVRLVHYLNDTDARKATRLRLPNELIINEFEADADAFRLAVAYSHQNARKVHCSFGALAAAYYILYRDNGADNAYVDAFFWGLAEGTETSMDRRQLDDVDPRRVLARRFLDLRLNKERRTALTQVGMIITSWNHCVLSKQPRALIFTNDQAIPAVLRCQPGQGAAPDAFRTVVA